MPDVWTHGTPDSVPWNAESYLASLSMGATEEGFSTELPPEMVEARSFDANEPATILDDDSHVLVWYLPQIVSLRMMVSASNVERIMIHIFN